MTARRTPRDGRHRTRPDGTRGGDLLSRSSHLTDMSLGESDPAASRASQFYVFATRTLAMLFVLAIFAGLGALVYMERLNGESLVFFAGVIVGYLAHVAATMR